VHNLPYVKLLFYIVYKRVIFLTLNIPVVISQVVIWIKVTK